MIVRPLDIEFAHKCGARFAPSYFGKPAIMFPVRRADGSNCAVQGRYIVPNDPPSQTKGPRIEGVFATPGALDKGVPLVVVEAPLDAITLAMAGVPAVALLGASGIPQWLVDRCIFRTVYAAFDNDAPKPPMHPTGAGDTAAANLAVALKPVGAEVKRLIPPKKEGEKKSDWNQILVEHGIDGLRECLKPFFDLIAAKNDLGADLASDDLGDIGDLSDLVDPFAEEDESLAPAALSPLAAACAAHMGYAVALVDTWKESITDEEYNNAKLSLYDAAERGALPVEDLPLSRGTTVFDANEFVCKTLERALSIQEELSEPKPSGEGFRLEGRARDLLTSELETACFHLEAVAAWYRDIVVS